MHQQTIRMPKSMRSSISHSMHHQSFLTRSSAYVTIPTLMFLLVAGAAEFASITSWRYFLAELMHAEMALGTVTDGIVELVTV